MPQDRISTAEAAEILGVSVNTLNHWRTTGRYGLPYVKVGRCVQYRRSDLDAFLRRRTVAPKSDVA